MPPNLPSHQAQISTSSTPLHKFAAIPLTPTLLLTEPGEMSELPATRLFKTFSYCLETVHFYSAEQVLRKDMKEKKPRIVLRDFLKHNFLDLLYECNGTGGTTSRRKKSINGRRTHVNGSKELFTILNHVFVCQNSILYVYMEFSVTFFSAECIILLLYTWKYKIYFIKDI